MEALAGGELMHLLSHHIVVVIFLRPAVRWKIPFCGSARGWGVLAQRGEDFLAAFFGDTKALRIIADVDSLWQLLRWTIDPKEGAGQRKSEKQQIERPPEAMSPRGSYGVLRHGFPVAVQRHLMQVAASWRSGRSAFLLRQKSCPSSVSVSSCR